MTAADWTALAGFITSITALLVAIGAGIKWLTAELRTRAEETIAAKNEEITALKSYVALLESKLRQRREPRS